MFKIKYKILKLLSIFLIFITILICLCYICIKNYFSSDFFHKTLITLNNKENIYLTAIIPLDMNGWTTYNFSNYEDIGLKNTYYDSTQKNVLIIERKYTPLFYSLTNDSIIFYTDYSTKIHNNLKSKTKIIFEAESYKLSKSNYGKELLVRINISDN
jgi:hypothetical protein